MDVVKPFFPGFTHTMFEGAFPFRCDNTYRRWYPVVAKFNPLSYLRADVISRKPTLLLQIVGWIIFASSDGLR